MKYGADPKDAARNLLFGLLAFQLSFIDRRALLAAFDEWTAHKSKPLGRVLTDQGAISEQRLALIEGLVKEHLSLHDDRAEKSLATLSPIGTLRKELEARADRETRASLTRVPISGDGDTIQTNYKSVGASTSAGLRFEVLRPLDKGGMGVVSVAIDKELDRPIALKEIRKKAADDRGYRTRFLAEAEITGKLEHPGIIPIYGLGTYDDGRPFYAMRLIRGGKSSSLVDAIQRYYKEPNSSSRAVEFRGLLGRFLDVCNVMAYAHDRGVLHRDLKPHNILLGPYGETLVVDWGLAKAQNRADPAESDVERVRLTLSGSEMSPTKAGTMIGTPEYAPPEQITGDLESVGPRSDVYGLGAVLYCLITGRPPFSRKVDGLGEVLRKVKDGDFPHPRQVRPDVDNPLEAICLKAMEAMPADRYESVRALADDVERYLADEPVSAYREPITVRARRWTNRHRTAVTASVVALVAASIGLASVAAVVTKSRNGLAAKNLELLKANVALDRQLTRAETREADAIAAVKRFGDAVANEEQLKNSPTLAPLRKKLLKEPIDFLRKLRESLQADADNRPESLSRLATAVFSLGLLTDEIGDKQDAVVAFRESQAIWQKLADDNPAVTRFQSELARSHNRLGKLLSATGKFADALNAYEAALAIYKKLADDNPTVTEFHKSLAMIHLSIGLLLSATGRPADVLKSCESALAIYKKLADDNPTVTEFQSVLAMIHIGIGDVLGLIGKPADALKAYEAALAIRRKLAKDNPAVADFQRELAASHYKLGSLLSETGKPADALMAYASALEIFQKLAKDNPTVTQFQSELAASHNNIGILLSDTGKPADALKAHESALAIRRKLADDNPTVTKFQSDLADGHHNIGTLLRETGKPADALKSRESALAIRRKLVDDNPTVTQFQSDLAGSHNDIGVLLSEAGKPADALKRYESARAIQKKLADDNPAVTKLQRDLAISHHNIGTLLSETGKPADALKSYELALAIRRKLADENPTVTEYQSALASSHHNFGNLLSATGKPAGALKESESALAIRRKLADDNPTVTQFQSELAVSYSHLGIRLSETGKPGDALTAYVSALEIFQKLAKDNPAATRFHSDMADCLFNFGILLSATGKPGDALKAYESALAIQRRLAREHPQSPDFASSLGGTLNNLARIDLNEERFEAAQVGFREAIEWQRKALAANPANPSYRQFLVGSLNNLADASAGSGDSAGVAEAEHELRRLRDSDPAMRALDAQLADVIRGDQPPEDGAEQRRLAQRAYDKTLYATAVRLWAEALDADPRLGVDHQAQPRYNAACAAALAGSGKGEDVPKPDEAAKAKLRARALEWLRTEAATFVKYVESTEPGDKAFVASRLNHWRLNPDLAGVRDPKPLIKLPRAEQAAWRALWAEVDALLAKTAKK